MRLPFGTLDLKVLILVYNYHIVIRPLLFFMP